MKEVGSRGGSLCPGGNGSRIKNSPDNATGIVLIAQLHSTRWGRQARQKSQDVSLEGGREIRSNNA